jgi:hypothetical protein
MEESFMATFPSQPPKPPKAFEHGSGFGKTTPAKIPAGETAPPTKTKSQTTSTHGKKDPDPGGTVYSTETQETKKASRLILVSRLLRGRDFQVGGTPTNV